MNILLVQPEQNHAETAPQCPSLALLTLGTLAQNEGHTVKVYHQGVDAITIDAALEKYTPDIIGITVNTFQVRAGRQIAFRAREFGDKKIRIVVGGPHAPVWDGEDDDIVIGQGEKRWLEILGSKRKIHTINDIPALDYSLVDLKKYIGISPVGAVPSMAMMASRGCPFDCTFCNTPVFWGKKVEYREPKLVVDEIAFLHRHYGYKEIFFQDDTFNLNHEWALEIFDRIISEELDQTMCFKICCRVNEKLLTEKFLKKAAKAGVWNIFFGIESGSQYMLDRMKKGITVAEIKRAIKMTKEAHIRTQCSFIIGLPGETRETIQETLLLVEETRPNSAGYVYACPFPMTELDKEVTQKGHKKEMGYAEYGYGLVMCRTDELTFKDLESYSWLVYGGE